MKISVRIFLLAIAITALISCGQQDYKKKPYAVKGVIDLTGWNFDKDGNVKLNGEWEFYWEKLLKPEDFRLSSSPEITRFIKMPRTWNNYKINGKKLSGEGYATFRLLIKLREKETAKAFNLPCMFTAYKLWINGKVVCSNGIVGRSRDEMKSQYLTKVVGFNPKSNSVELILQISSFTHTKGGVRKPLSFGNEKQLHKEKEKSLILGSFFVGCLLIMGVYYLVFYYARKKEKAALYFAIFCLMFAVRATISGDMILTTLFPLINWHLQIKTEFLIFYTSIPLFLVFLYNLFPKEIPKTMLRVTQIIGLAIGIFTIITPPQIFTEIMKVYFAYMIIMLPYGLGILILASIRKRDGAKYLVIGYFIFIFCGFNDILVFNEIIKTPLIGSIGLLVFVITQSFVLSIRFSKTFNEAEELSENLEKRVIKRTEELLNKTQELIVIKENLEKNNREMEGELHIAKHIQMSLIPSVSPISEMAFYYKPMNLIGGDFFDFMKFRDSDKFSIFISDVSGHGVPAAFITAMINSFILKSRNLIDNPAEFLMSFNDFLINQTAGNFVTVFYGIFDPNSCELKFANAGHNLPYLISEKQITALKSISTGIPLAILSNDDLKKIHKKYVNNTVVLEKKSKLILYTDGLTEAINIDDEANLPFSDIKDFETTCLMNAFRELAPLSPKNFIAGLEKKLIAFRGNNDFEDDVCIICLDIK